MGYENCGRREEYPYDALLDGKPHVILADSEAPLRALRYGAERRGLRFRQCKIGVNRYMVQALAARVEGSRLSGSSPGAPLRDAGIPGHRQLIRAASVLSRDLSNIGIRQPRTAPR